MVKNAFNIKTPSLGALNALLWETGVGPSGSPSGGIFVSQILGLIKKSRSTINMKTLLSLVSLPIMLLNFAGGIVAGIWLIIQGHWGLPILAILISIGVTWIISIFLAPTILLAMPMTAIIEKRKFGFIYLLGGVSSLWTYAVMTAWCVGAFIVIISNWDGGSIWPYVLLGYSLATGPWTYMASKEGSNGVDATSIGTFFICLGSLAMLIATLIAGEVNSTVLYITFGIAMGIAFIIQMILLTETVKGLRYE